MLPPIGMSINADNTINPTRNCQYFFSLVIHEADAEAARETASHTLESGAARIEETTEDKGDTENG